MSLPTGGTWPPEPYSTAFAQQSVWSAWLSGDPEALSKAYGSSYKPLSTYFGDRDGGLLPAVARFFWGRPSVSGQRKYRLHVPLAADIATASADMLFSEPPQFIPAEGSNDRAAARIDELLNVGEFHAYLLESAELISALGGGWLRLVWDEEVAERVMLDSVAADLAYGEWRWGILQAVTFFTEFSEANDTTRSKVLRHLERHEPGRVLHGLYAGSGDDLGRAIPLADHASTLPFADLVDEEGAISTGVKGLTAAYIANMRPNRRWRKMEQLSEMGRSDYDGVEQLMDALDESYTSWMRDLRLARARIIVPEFMLKDLGKGQGMAWDEDQEVFTQLSVAPVEKGAGQITPQQFAIRTEEHKATVEQLVREIVRAAGYSSSTFQEQAEGMLTATEVVAQEKTSNRTRDKKTRYFSQGLGALLTTWLELDARIFKSEARGAVEVVWPDTSQPEPEALARTVNTLTQAQALSVDTKVRMLHPDWNEEQLVGEVEAIKAEQGMLVPEIGPLP